MLGAELLLGYDEAYFGAQNWVKAKYEEAACEIEDDCAQDEEVRRDILLAEYWASKVEQDSYWSKCYDHPKELFPERGVDPEQRLDVFQGVCLAKYSTDENIQAA